jgi:hypothetical protein
MENFIDRFKGHWWRYFIQFPFEWWVTATFKDLANGKPVKSEYAKVKLKTWARKLIKEERLQIAYFGVLNQANRIHLHLLMLGRNRHGKTLLDVSATEWENAWKAQSKIQPVYDIDGVSKYFEHNIILKDYTLSDVIPFNIKLLRRVQIKEGPKSPEDSNKPALDLDDMFHFSNKDNNLVRSQMIELIGGFQ